MNDVVGHGRPQGDAPHFGQSAYQQAVEIIRGEAGKHFDPVLVAAFLRAHEQFDVVRARIDGDATLVTAGRS